MVVQDGGCLSAVRRNKTELTEHLINVECLAWEARRVDEEELGDMFVLGAETKGVIISAPIVRSIAPLVETAATFKSLTLDGVLGSFGSKLQVFLEQVTILKELCAMPTTLLENRHVRLQARNFHDHTGAMEMMELAGPTNVWGCAKTLTRLEIVIERQFLTYIDETDMPIDNHRLPMSPESWMEHTIAYEQ